MSTETNRLLMELERVMRNVNTEVINPRIPELHMDDLKPVLEIVAIARAEYLTGLFALPKDLQEDQPPSDDDIKKLRRLRVRYEELMEGAKALEAAIQRGYLDIQ